MMPSFSRHTRKLLLIAFGFVTLLLGIIGVFLPLLPTTPFLLLSAWAWMKSSRRFYEWLVSNKYLGTYIRNYREKRSITVRHKIITLVILWLGIGYAAIFVATRVWLTVLLFAIAVGVTVHLMMLKTLSTGAKKPGTRGEEEATGSGRK